MAERGRRIASVGALAVLLATMLCAAPPAGATAVGTPLGPDPAFVASAYHDFLGRVPHGVEWDVVYDQDLTTVAGRSSVVSKLAKSPEWVTRTVQKMYQDTLGRPGDPGGVTYWVSMIRSGRLSVAHVAAMLYSSSEYFTKYAGSDLRTWVGDLYAKLLLRPGSSDPSGVDYWTTTAARRGRTAVAYAFFQSSESRHVRVEALYQTLLGRAPDVAGWNYWAVRIQTSGDLALASSLAASAEYDARAAVRFADAGPGTWGLFGVGPGDHLLGGVVLGPDLVGTGGVVCTLPCTSPTTLPNAAGYSQVQVVGITTGGVIVGSAIDADGAFAGLVWNDASSTPTPIAVPAGATDVLVGGVSAAGVVVGSAIDGSGFEKPYAWSSPEAQPTPLATPPGSTDAWADGVSPSGAIFGEVVVGDTQVAGLVWASPGATPVEVPAGYHQVQINAMSASGELVGIGVGNDGKVVGLTWSSPSANPSAIAVPSGSGGAIPESISPSGEIVGLAVGTDASNVDGVRPVVWASSSQGATLLPIPAGYGGTWAVGILSDGDIVGNSLDALDDVHVVDWTSTVAGPTVLPTLF